MSAPVFGARRLAATAVLALGMVVAGCSSAAAPSITVTGAWARPSSMDAAAGAAYMVISNTGSAGDTLIGASSPAATTVEVHETYVVEASPSDGMGSPMPSGGMGGSPMPSGSMDGGMMGMRPIPRLDIPANGSVELKPGSYHVMLIGLTGDLTPGTTIEITLRFEKAGEVKVTADVRAG